MATDPPARSQRGRPTRAQAGEAETRILRAAATLFLEQGFGRTTLDQVVAAAHTSKTTLYKKWPTKDDLFAAVVEHASRDTLDHMDQVQPDGSPVQRLVAAGLALADLTLTADSIALMRMTAAEAELFPDLARQGFAIGFGACVDCIARSLANDDSDHAASTVTPLATRFVELALHPLYMHAFFGHDLVELRARARDVVPGIAEILLGQDNSAR